MQDWEVKARFVSFHLVKSSVNGDELARIIIEVLHGKLNVAQGFVLAAIRDRPSQHQGVTNGVCVQKCLMLGASPSQV